MTSPDDQVPWWQKSLGVILLLLILLFIVGDWARFKADFIPVDGSRVGPNLVASVITWALVLIVAALVWPPTRRRIHRFIDHKADAIKAHVTSEQDELHRKLDHIIHHHPDIPPLPAATTEEE